MSFLEMNFERFLIFCIKKTTVKRTRKEYPTAVQVFIDISFKSEHCVFQVSKKFKWAFKVADAKKHMSPIKIHCPVAPFISFILDEDSISSSVSFILYV